MRYQKSETSAGWISWAIDEIGTYRRWLNWIELYGVVFDWRFRRTAFATRSASTSGAIANARMWRASSSSSAATRTSSGCKSTTSSASSGASSSCQVKSSSLSSLLSLLSWLSSRATTIDWPLFQHLNALILMIAFLILWRWFAAFAEMVLAGTFASWYWAFKKPHDVPTYALTNSFFRTIR